MIAINTDNTILAGHQRCHIMLELGWGEKEIEVRVPFKKLNKKDADEYLIRSNKNIGDWDFDILANQFDIEDLLNSGFSQKDFELELSESEADSSDSDSVEVKEKCPKCGHEF